MVRYFYRHFRVVDCSRHCGMPVATACFLLAIITGAMQVYSLYFLYEAWAYILMGYAGATALFGLMSVLTGFRIFTILYLLAETLCNIPVGVVIGYISYLLANWCYNYRYGYCFYDTYTAWLYFHFSQGFLWSGEIVACLSVPFSFLTLAGYRKLRLHQAGVNTAVQHGRGHLAATNECVVEAQHHHHHPVVIQQQPVVAVQQPTVIAVPTAQPAVVVQTAPSVYPQLHGATVLKQNQPTTLYIQ